EARRQRARRTPIPPAAPHKPVARLPAAEAYITELVDLLRARGVLSDEDLADEEAEETGSSQQAEAIASWEEPPEDAAADPSAAPSAGSLAAVSTAVAAEEHGQEPALEAVVTR